MKSVFALLILTMLVNFSSGLFFGTPVSTKHYDGMFIIFNVVFILSVQPVEEIMTVGQENVKIIPTSFVI